VQGFASQSCRTAPKMYRENKQGTFDSEKGFCLFIYWNLVYLSSDCNDVKDLVPEKKRVYQLLHEMYENVLKNLLELNI